MELANTGPKGLKGPFSTFPVRRLGQPMSLPFQKARRAYRAFRRSIGPTSVGRGCRAVGVGEPQKGVPLALSDMTFPQAAILPLVLCKKKKLCKSFGLPREPYSPKGFREPLCRKMGSFVQKNGVTFSTFVQKNGEIAQPGKEA